MSANPNNNTNQKMLVLAAIGIVFGDIGTSPLYAFRECFHYAQDVPPNPENVLGVLSLIFWSLWVVISFKYLRFVMKADNKGEGGILALTAKAVMPSSQQAVTGFNKIFLALGLFGASLLVGDGMITPAISVLSAVEGLKVAIPAMNTEAGKVWVVFIAIVILIGLFSIQKHGTQKIGAYFGPVMVLWFGVLGVLGLFQIVQNPSVLMAASPHFAFQFVATNAGSAFVVFGSVFLAVTGGEALYADMGHFGLKSIAKAWYFCALPGLLLNYFGQGALLISDPTTVINPFYHLAPEWALYPLVLLATGAAIIASQAIISGLFSLARQCIQLGYCPRLRISYTSEHHAGQIYVPFINWVTMFGTLWLVLEFRSSSNLSAAYGIAISIDMMITTILAAVVAANVWKWPTKKVAWLISGLLVVDLAFFGANVLKIEDGGWVPLVIASLVFFLMRTWKKGRHIMADCIRERSYPFQQLLSEIQAKPPVRVPGVAVFMVGDAKTTPPALIHNLKHNKVLHEHVIFLTVVGADVPHVKMEEQLSIEKDVGPGIDRVVASYGFSDIPDIPKLLKQCAETQLGFTYDNVTYFLGREVLMASSRKSGEMFVWRKRVFSFMAKNAMVAAHFFKLPKEDVIEVGMEMEF